MNIVKKTFDLLKKNDLRLAFCESCTGGLVSSLITKIPGSSKVFVGAIIAYSNETKKEILHVKKETLDNEGAVSEQCALEMVNGLSQILRFDIGVSITGIAGPDGGSLKKPIGFVCFGFNILGNLFTMKMNFHGSRIKIQKKASFYVYNVIFSEIKKKFGKILV